MRAHGFGTLAATAAIAVLAGCAGFITSEACPAIGWSNNLTVDLVGDTAPVDVVQVCFDGRCSSLRGTQPEPAPTLEFVTVNPEELPALPSETPPDWDPLFVSSKIDDGTWVVHFDMSAPEEISVRALDAQAQVLAADTYTITWTRVGGSEQCGGPMEAGPITLNL